MHRFEGVVVSLALVINLDTLLQRLDHVGRRGRALNRALDVPCDSVHPQADGGAYHTGRASPQCRRRRF